MRLYCDHYQRLEYGAHLALKAAKLLRQRPNETIVILAGRPTSHSVMKRFHS